MHVLSTPPAFILSQDQTLRIFAEVPTAYLTHPVRSETTAPLRKALQNSKSSRSRNTPHPAQQQYAKLPKTTDRSAGLAYLATLQLLMCLNSNTLLHNLPPNQIPFQLICIQSGRSLSSDYRYPSVPAEKTGILRSGTRILTLPQHCTPVKSRMGWGASQIV